MNSLVQTLSISARRSILDAIEHIEAGALQIAFVVDDGGCLVGVVTNGDVRRHLLQGGQTDAPVTTCMNRQFRAVAVGTSREELLKLFDLGYIAIPGVDAEQRLAEVYTRQLAASAEVPVLARARAPVRMSFCGGGTDLTYFFIDHPAAVLSCTVGLYAHATLVPRKDQQISIHAEDLAREEHFHSLADLLAAPEKSLLATIIAVIKPDYGFDLFLRSDFPVGSGLGGSSAATTATIAVFNELRQDRWSTYEIAELAFQAERLCFGIAGGWQDQYASAFGGFNLIEFENQRNLVHPIRLEDAIRNEFESCLLLCNTGISHDSGRLHEQQREEIEAQDSQTELLHASVALCRRMHRHLIRGELRGVGVCLDEAWRLKKRFSTAISHGRLDDIYEAAIAAGAVGGKLLGAGGGGFFLFYVQPQLRQRVIRVLSELGCETQNFRFESSGVTSWRAKIQ
ncbi:MULTISPECIES: CBS domain-containing protein [unclassified Pseudomonas]|uniref:GHMP family kinase ATP-binding protein n=1 Tax=unclassified Pseudomonas TaxID=196821 RepID=UPI000C8830F9|nr:MULTISPECIES: CBS domain-containing protein [unclassified Pseudomonas]PMZ98235.1 sugar kinase [Pseudomonas sp. FW305-42]PNA22721.1 sugar kinase [Pseudomonas sp. MPR-R1B]PNB25596.1 sugar kinase [Pseudomonas sp. DP16D-E2]PNB42750.1 sugar kinase [Pseudomonas sp. FW305-17]PNB59147.1 sugar kinase [Pseudomonas sp. GW531-E2]